MRFTLVAGLVLLAGCATWVHPKYTPELWARDDGECERQDEGAEARFDHDFDQCKDKVGAAASAHCMDLHGWKDCRGPYCYDRCLVARGWQKKSSEDSANGEPAVARPKTPTTPKIVVPGDKALLIAYTPKRFGGVTSNIYLDGKLIGQTRPGMFFVTEVAPGVRYLMAQDQAGRSSNARLNFEAGKTYALQCRSIAGWAILAVLRSATEVRGDLAELEYQRFKLQGEQMDPKEYGQLRDELERNIAARKSSLNDMLSYQGFTEPVFPGTQAASQPAKPASVAPASDSKTVKCPSCGASTAPGKFCSQCGKALPVSCTKCGAPLPMNSRFCPNCGQAIVGPDTATDSAPKTAQPPP